MKKFPSLFLSLLLSNASAINIPDDVQITLADEGLDIALKEQVLKQPKVKLPPYTASEVEVLQQLKKQHAKLIQYEKDLKKKEARLEIIKKKVEAEIAKFNTLSQKIETQRQHDKQVREENEKKDHRVKNMLEEIGSIRELSTGLEEKLVSIKTTLDKIEAHSAQIKVVGKSKKTLSAAGLTKLTKSISIMKAENAASTLLGLPLEQTLAILNKLGPSKVARILPQIGKISPQKEAEIAEALIHFSDHDDNKEKK